MAAIPKPPGLWHALAREAVLNPEERAARAAVVAEVQRPETAERPDERLKPYEPILHQAGWRVRFTADDDRARIEAFHPDGAALMLTAVHGRGINVYVLHTAVKQPRWLGTTPWALEHFAECRQLAPDARRWGVASKCHCEKTGRFPTEAWAKKALTDIRINKEFRQKRRATERRVYRCPDDDRVWHITSRQKWYSDTGRGQKADAR